MKHLVLAVMMILSAESLSALEIKVVTENIPPLNYEENGKIVGISTEIVRAVLEKAGIEVNITVYPWARAYNMSSEQENVLIYSIAKTPEREKLFKWIGPLYPYTESLFKLKKRKDIAVHSLDDAKKYKIGVVREYAVHQMLRSQGFIDGKNLDAVSAQELNIKKLFKERVDMIVGSSLDLSWRMRTQADLPPFEDLEQAFELKEIFTEIYMAFGVKTSDEVVGQIRTAFDQLKAEGKIDSILQRYR